MGKKIEKFTATELTPVAKGIRRIMKFPVFLLKVVYIIPFLVFGLWLLHTIYFPEVEIGESAALPNYIEEEDIFEVIMNKKEPVPRGHFHMIDEYISVRESNPPLCVVCHGTYPHGKEKKDPCHSGSTGLQYDANKQMCCAPWNPKECYPVSGGGMMPGGDKDKHGCKPSTGYHWIKDVNKYFLGTVFAKVNQKIEFKSMEIV